MLFISDSLTGNHRTAARQFLARLGSLLLVLLFTGLSVANAQTAPPAGAKPPVPRYTPPKFSSDIAQFPADVDAIMAGTKNEQAMAAGSAFGMAWATGRINWDQQNRIIKLAQSMLEKKARARPHFQSLFSSLANAVNVHSISGGTLDGMLLMLEKTNDKTDLKTLDRVLKTTDLFLNEKALYVTRSNSLRVAGGTFGFDYKEGALLGSFDEPEEPAKKEETIEEAIAAQQKAAPKKEDDGWGNDDGWADDGWGTPKKKDPKKKATDKKKVDDGWGNNSGWGSDDGSTITEDAVEKESGKDIVETVPYLPAAQPSVTGPVITISNADLAIMYGGDSAVIRQTSGSVMLMSNIFVGNGGRLSWNRAGHPESDAVCELKEYNFNTSKAFVEAEMVTLTYASVLDKPIQGNVRYKGERPRPGGTRNFPHFVSLTNDAKIRNLGEDINYKGGFTLAGTKVASGSVDESPSYITVGRGGKQKFRSSSRNYILGDSLITAKRASVSIYEGQDSIYHPALKFKYSKPRGFLTLLKDAGAYKNTPYLDSFHELEIKTDMLKWAIDSPQVNFSILNAKAQVAASFESTDFFEAKRYIQLKGAMTFHPLQLVIGFAQRTKQNKFFASELAQDSKLPVANIKAAMSDLAKQGFIDYNGASGYVILKPKAWHYVVASKGKKDFDNLALNSISSAGKNATLNLNNNELRVRGVDRFEISDSLGVFIEPKNKEVVINRNREIAFDGRVTSGNFRFSGTEFKFDYENFLVDLAKIDSINFDVEDKNKKRDKNDTIKATSKKLSNKLRQSSGKLYINKPDNKSGRRRLPRYPYFDSHQGAYVYFNQPEVLGGVYDTTVYFNVPPFTVDSIENKNGSSAIMFKGTFHAGEIFPSFEQTLSVMPDKSLGFVHQVPPSGFDLYLDKGKYNGQISLSNKGLRGLGVIKYQAATLESEDFVFYHDSVTTNPGKKFTIREGTQGQASWPAVSVDGYKMKWFTEQDSMQVSTLKGAEMKFYKEQLTFQGTTTLTPKGLFGSGKAETAQARMTSPLYHFKENDFSGSNAVFEIKSSNPEVPALMAKDAKFSFNVDSAKAEFSPMVEGQASVAFPALQYKTSLSGGKADFKTKIVEMELPRGSDVSKSYFYSTHPDQDSLVFQATGARYDMDKYTLNVFGVPRIPVFTSYIYPDSGKVFITEGADMKVLQNARILMDTLGRYHTFHSGEIDILSRKHFVGTAMLDYVNAKGDTFGIRFNNFAYDSVQRESNKKEYSFFTSAQGGVSDTAKFEIMPKVYYFGDVSLQSWKPEMNFNGNVKLAFAGGGATAEWFPFSQIVDPDSIRLNVEKLLSSDGEPLHTGLHLSASSGSLYSTFVSKKTEPNDLDVFPIQGVLSYDKTRKLFKIGDIKKSYGQAYAGNLLLYNDSTERISYEGKFNFINPNKNFQIVAAGSGTALPDSNRYRMETMMSFDINMPSAALDKMGVIMNDRLGGGMEAVSLTDAALPYRLAEFLGENGLKAYQEKTKESYVPFSKAAPKIMKSLLLNDVKLRWSPAQNAWYSVGNFGLVSAGKTDVNGLTKGYLEIKRTANGDAVTLYIEANPGTWFYFGFAENTLKAVSTDSEFNNIMKGKGNQATASETQYVYMAAEPMDKGMFVNYFRTTYLGAKAEQIVDEPAFEIGGGIEEAPAEETSTTKKKKEKKKKEAPQQESDMDMPPSDIPPADVPQPDAPAEQPVEKPTKKKKEKKAEQQESDMDMPPADVPPAETPPANTPPAETPPAETTPPPAETPVEQTAPPAEKPPVEQTPPPVETPPAEQQTQEEAPAEQPTIEEAPADAPVVKEKKKKKKEKADEESPDVEMSDTP